MTSSTPSDEKTTGDLEASPTSRQVLNDEVCRKCGGPTRLRNAAPFPVALQTAFGVSFVLFLIVQSNRALEPKYFWAWSFVQIVLGILLVRARYAAAKKVFICLRCGAPLP